MMQSLKVQLLCGAHFSWRQDAPKIARAALINVQFNQTEGSGRRKIANIYCFILLIQWAWILNVAALCHLPIIMSLSQFLLLPLYYSIHKTMKNLEVYLHSVEEILDFTQTYYFSFSSPPHLDITYVCMGSQYFPPPCLCDIMWFCGNCGVEQKEELKNVLEPHFNIQVLWYAW